MRPLRLCLIIPTLDRGGAEKQLCLLANGIDRNQFEPHVLCLTRGGPREAELQQGKTPFSIIGKRLKLDPWAYRRLKKQLVSLNPDIVHTWIFAANAYGRLAARRAKVPVVLGGERCVDPWKRPFEFWIDRWLARIGDGIITNSQGVVDFYGSRGISTKLFHVIPNGISTHSKDIETGFQTRIDRDTACQRLGLTKERRMIAVIGRLWPQKGHKELFWAIELLRVARPEVVLVVIGDGPLRQRLEHYRDQLRAADAIRIYGERDDISELLPHFEIVINGSLYEGQSNSILEAMSYGIPVIASDIAGNRDLVIHGKTGLLFQLNDTHGLAKDIHRLLDDEALRSKLGNAARERITSEFSVEKMIRSHQQLYQQLWAKKNSSAK